MSQHQCYTRIYSPFNVKFQAWWVSQVQVSGWWKSHWYPSQECLNWGFLCGASLLLFLDDINEMKMWDTYIENEYLEAKSLGKVYIIVGT